MMSESAELAFVKSHLNVLGSLPVQYPDDFQQPLADSLKKIPIIPVELPSPPAPKSALAATTSDSINLTFKSTKPPKSYSLSINPTDTISTIKSQLAGQPGAPPADGQRLLLRGKALADAKLLKEYAVKDGDVVNLMLRPGFEWDWEPKPVTPSISIPPSPIKDGEGDVSMRLEVNSRPTRKHSRIPSVVLSPSPSPSSTSLPLIDAPSDIELTLDAPDIANVADNMDSYHKKISSPEFWERMYEFLRSEFDAEEDTRNAFEAFFVGAKGSLTPHEIAKVRDTIGIVGMGGL